MEIWFFTHSFAGNCKKKRVKNISILILLFPMWSWYFNISKISNEVFFFKYSCVFRSQLSTHCLFVNVTLNLMFGLF